MTTNAWSILLLLPCLIIGGEIIWGRKKKLLKWGGIKKNDIVKLWKFSLKMR